MIINACIHFQPIAETLVAAVDQNPTKEPIVQETDKQSSEKIEKTPMELHHAEEQTKTRFSGRKNLADFFDSTTQIIETKVCFIEYD